MGSGDNGEVGSPDVCLKFRLVREDFRRSMRSPVGTQSADKGNFLCVPACTHRHEDA